MDKSSDSASLSFSSDTDFLSDTYVIVDPEVKRNGTVVLESLLHPAVIMNIMAFLDEEPAQQTVFFPAFSRYFVARVKSYENMIEDLIWHREAHQNGGAPLIFFLDVPKLRRIAHKRMGFLKATYRIFKDSSTTIEQPNIDLIKTYMKACVRHYHALLPQLDLLAAQWGVDDLGSLRSQGVWTRRQTSLDKQLRIQVQEAKKRQVGTLEKSRTPRQGASSSNSTKVFSHGKTSNSNPSEELQRMTRQAKDEVAKRRLTEERLSRIEEDYRNLQRQHKSSASTLTGSTIPPVQVSLSVPTENPRLSPLLPERLPPLPPDSVLSSYMPQESNASSDVEMQLL
jgi:hypothetical protein